MQCWCIGYLGRNGEHGPGLAGLRQNLSQRARSRKAFPLCPHQRPAWSRGSVQQGLSAAGGALGFYRLGLAADKRYSLGVMNDPVFLGLSKAHWELFNSFSTWLSAIGTIAAVVVSLWLATLAIT